MIREARVLIVGSTFVLMAMDKNRFISRGSIGHGIAYIPGGVIQPGESPEMCAVRCAREMVNAELGYEDLMPRGTLTFYAEDVPYKTIEVFRTTQVKNNRGNNPPGDTTLTYARHALRDILPFEQMQAGYHTWVDPMVRGKWFDANLYYRSPDGEFLSIEVLDSA
ncbi:MAG: NUDIX domain-containing protein [Patescibacteria group bacterium]